MLLTTYLCYDSNNKTIFLAHSALYLQSVLTLLTTFSTPKSHRRAESCPGIQLSSKTSFVSPVLCGLRLTSHLRQRDFSCFWFGVFVWFCVVLLWFSLFLFAHFWFVWFRLLFPLLLAALSLTGAQRTDSSSASKKKSCQSTQFEVHLTLLPPFERKPRSLRENP